MPSTILNYVVRQRQVLKDRLAGDMQELAEHCASLMDDPLRLEALLEAKFSVPRFFKYLWVLDHAGIQVTATVARNKLKTEQRGRDRAARPYIQRALAGEKFYLSDAYISRHRKRPSLTSVQTIVDDEGRTLGFLGADFDLRELPHTGKLKLDKKGWQQLKGDPAIRGGLFAQQRVVSAMDEKFDDVLDLMVELMIAHGVFHAKLHFSSSRATIWLANTPYDYQLLSIDELTDPSLCLAFPKQAYLKQATVPRGQIKKIFRQFKKLRFADETIYLRSASLNVVNGKVGLNFSCDGSHYVSWEEFLKKDNSFWFGVN